MLKKLLVVALFLFIWLLFPQTTFAEEEFLTSYDVTYNIENDASTEVIENITLKNTTDKFYASNFTLLLSSSKIRDIQAQDSQGELETKVTTEGNKTKIMVEFGQQIVGKDKEYKWILKFKTDDFAQKLGQVWQVSIPRISTASGADSYKYTLSVPVSFGDPTSISPEPVSDYGQGGRLNYRFTKEQLSSSGVLANFGKNQLFDFDLTYDLENNNLLPAEASLPLPSDTQYQQVMIKNITPQPENVTVDADGNYLAWYKLAPRESKKVDINGLAKLSLVPAKRAYLNQDQIEKLTAAQDYWDKNNPLIITRLSEIFKGDNPKSTKEKAKMINDFVVNFLQYDTKRVEKDDFERLGALRAVSRPENSLCGEFSDLFITLARAKGIPARELVGFAYTENEVLRPRSFGTILHSWPEYYDPAVGWVMIDPTWQNTSGGVDYFNQMDLNHFVLSTRGYSSTDPTPSNNIKVSFYEGEFKPLPKVSIFLNSPLQILSGFPAKLTVELKNEGSGLAGFSDLALSSSKIGFSTPTNTILPPIPPYGSVKKDFDLRPSFVWESYQDVVIVRVGKEEIQKLIIIKPFFQYKAFGIGVAAVVLVMFLVYVVTFELHRRANKNVSP